MINIHRKPSLTVGNLFKNKSELILRLMFSDLTHGWTGAELAERLNLSPAWAARVLATLEFEKFALHDGNKPHGKYYLKNTSKLIERWQLSYHIDFNESHTYRIIDLDPLRFITKVSKKEGVRYAITGQGAKDLKLGKKIKTAPVIYIIPNTGTKKFLSELEDKYDLIPTHKKPNLIFMLPYSGEGVFMNLQMIKSISCVSDLQITLDTHGLTS